MVDDPDSKNWIDFIMKEEKLQSIAIVYSKR